MKKPPPRSASLTSFQDAHTLEPLKARIFVAGTSHTALVDSSSGFKDPGASYLCDIGARLGVLGRMDIGLQYSIPGGMAGDVKYMLTPREATLGFSTGLKIGYYNFDVEFTDSAGNASGKVTTPTTIDATIPLYASYYPASWLSLSLTPHATYRTVIGAWFTAGPILGVNGTLKLGKSGGVLVEGGAHKALESGGPVFLNYSAAIYFPISLSFEDLVKDATKNF